MEPFLSHLAQTQEILNSFIAALIKDGHLNEETDADSIAELRRVCGMNIANLRNSVLRSVRY